MKSNILAYGIGVGSLCLSMAAAVAQTATTTQAPAQQGSSAARATEPAAPAGASSATPSLATPSSGTPAMTPSAAEVKAGTQGAADPGAGALPAPQQSGGVTYITGGFGDNQANAFKEAGAKHSVMMVFSETGGAYLADVPVRIKAKGEGANVDIKAAGPYLLVDLPNGSYTAEASHQGKSQTRDFTVSGQKGQRISFTW
jgi:hypothetical protein